MSFDYNRSIDMAIKRCDGMIGSSEWDQIYPFTTENISGYINQFDLCNKSLLTVGSSGDQIINAILNGCHDITLLDINPYAKFFYFLKVSCLLCLDLDNFMTFLRYKDFPQVFKDNNDVFNRNIFNRIKSTLRIIDYESYLFWDELFQTFDPTTVRKSLFSMDENRTYVISDCNNYLKNNIIYEESKGKIKKTIPKFINSDLYELNLNDDYDNIWLSNIGTRISSNFLKIIVDKLSYNLNCGGKLLVSYLYDTTKDTVYKDGWSLIYDLKNTFKMLIDYDLNLVSFIGVDGIKFNNDNLKDSILVYRKHR